MAANWLFAKVLSRIDDHSGQTLHWQNTLRGEEQIFQKKTAPSKWKDSCVKGARKNNLKTER